MSEMPWVRFFPSDWLAGTRGLSAAETGIYITLIATMYERGEPVPEDVSRLARRCGASVAAFRTALENLVEEGKIVRTDAGLWNDRVGKESEYRAEKSEVGRQAAAARWSKKDNKNKGSKDADAMLAQSERNANQKPEARAATQQGENAYEHLLERLTEAAGLSGFREEKHTGLATVAPILGLLEAGYDLDADILPAIRAKCATGFKPRTWAYFIEPIREAALTRTHAASKPKPAAPETDWLDWCQGFFETGIWKDALGPKPGEPGCRAPPDIIQKAQHTGRAA